MTAKTFDKETLLDLTVNFVPLFIILFFVVGFAVFTPWGLDFSDPGTVIQYALLLFPFLGLSVLTYLSGKAIAGSEDDEEDEGDALETTDADEPAAPTEADGADDSDVGHDPDD